jgi:hypothetical protein
MARLHFPIVVDSACEGEDCDATNFAAVACDSAVLHAAASDSSPIVARIPVGDTVHVIARSLHILQPGIVLVRRDYTLANHSGEGRLAPPPDTSHFFAGDILYLLRYLELGSWMWTYHGKVQSGDEFWGGSIDAKFGGSSQDTTYAVRLSEPMVAHWWHVQPRRGGSGWWHEETEPALESVNQHVKWGNHCALVHAPSSPPASEAKRPR